MKQFKYIAYFTLFLFIVILSPSLFADEPESKEGDKKIKQISLKECVIIAIQNHPDFQISIEERKNAIAQYRYAKALSNIMINGEIKTIEVLKEDADTVFTVPGQDSYIGLWAGFSATYSLFDAKKSRMEKSARKSMDLVKIKSQKDIDTIIFNVKTAYYKYLISDQQVDLSDQLFKKHKRKLKLAKMLFRIGQRPILDVSRAKVGYYEANLANEKAKLHRKQMRTTLFASMGVHNEDMDIKLQDVDELPTIKYSIQDLYHLGEMYYPDLRYVKVQKEIKKLQISIERAYRYPTVNLLFGLGYQNTELRGESFDAFSSNFSINNWTPRVYGAFQMAFPIYDGGAINAKVDIATSQYKQIIYQERDAIMKMRNIIQVNYHNLIELKKQLEMSNVVIENAQKHQLLARKSYQNGIGTQLELQDAELTVINARLNYVRTKYDYMITLAKISSIVGVGEERLCKTN